MFARLQGARWRDHVHDDGQGRKDALHGIDGSDDPQLGHIKRHPLETVQRSSGDRHLFNGKCFTTTFTIPSIILIISITITAACSLQNG